MTALQLTPAEVPATRSRWRPRGLGWLMWRQHRLMVWLWLAVVVAAAVAFPLLRSAMVSFIDSHHIAGCAEISTDSRCQQPELQEAVAQFRLEYGDQLKGIGLLLLVLPAGLGVFVAAPLLARELESGTWKLVMAQSVSRTRWLAAKLLTVGAVCALGAAALMALFRWLWLPSATNVSGIAWCSQTFVVSGGPLLVATVLLALAVGVTVGTLLRRVVPAQAVTLVAVVALQYGLTSVRPHLWPWQTELVSMSELPNDTWGFDNGYLMPDGSRRPYGSNFGNGVEFSDVHHAADYWPLQLVESGICLVIATVLVVFTFRWTQRRLA